MLHGDEHLSSKPYVICHKCRKMSRRPLNRRFSISNFGKLCGWHLCEKRWWKMLLSTGPVWNRAPWKQVLVWNFVQAMRPEIVSRFKFCIFLAVIRTLAINMFQDWNLVLLTTGLNLFQLPFLSSSMSSGARSLLISPYLL